MNQGIINYFSAVVDNDGMVAEVEVKVLLGGEGEQIGAVGGPGNDVAVIGRQEALPDGVELCGGTEVRCDQHKTAGVLRSGERQRGGYAIQRQRVDIRADDVLHRHC